MDDPVTEAQISLSNLQLIEDQRYLIKKTAMKDALEIKGEKPKQSQERSPHSSGLELVSFMSSKSKGQCFARCKGIEAQHTRIFRRILEALSAMSLDINNLRDRMFLAGMEPMKTILLEIQIEVISKGLARLQQGRVRANLLRNRTVQRIDDQIYKSLNDNCAHAN